MVSRNRVELLRACLQSIHASQERERLQLIVVDNGSSDGAAQLETEFPDVQYIRLPKNFGLTKALNLGWRAADAPYVIFLHDDTRVQPDTIPLLAAALDANADAAAVCPLPGGRCGPTRAATGSAATHRRVASRRTGRHRSLRRAIPREAPR